MTHETGNDKVIFRLTRNRPSLFLIKNFETFTLLTSKLRLHPVPSGTPINIPTSKQNTKTRVSKEHLYIQVKASKYLSDSYFYVIFDLYLNQYS